MESPPSDEQGAATPFMFSNIECFGYSDLSDSRKTIHDREIVRTFFRWRFSQQFMTGFIRVQNMTKSYSLESESNFGKHNRDIGYAMC